MAIARRGGAGGVVLLALVMSSACDGARFVSLRPPIPMPARAPSNTSGGFGMTRQRSVYEDKWPDLAKWEQVRNTNKWPHIPGTVDFFRRMWINYNITDEDRRPAPLPELPNVSLLKVQLFNHWSVWPSITMCLLCWVTSAYLWGAPQAEDTVWESQKLFQTHGDFDSFWATAQTQPVRMRAYWIAQMCMMAGDYTPKYFDVNGIIDTPAAEILVKPSPSPEAERRLASGNWRQGMMPVSLNGKIAAGRASKDSDLLEDSLSNLMRLKRMLTKSRTGTSYLEINSNVGPTGEDDADMDDGWSLLQLHASAQAPPPKADQKHERKAARRCWKRLKEKVLHRTDLVEWQKKTRSALKALAGMLLVWGATWLVTGILAAYRSLVRDTHCSFANLPGRPESCALDGEGQEQHQMCRFKCQNQASEYMFLMCFKTRDYEFGDVGHWIPLNTCRPSSPPCFQPWSRDAKYDDYCATREDMFSTIGASVLQKAMDTECARLSTSIMGTSTEAPRCVHFEGKGIGESSEESPVPKPFARRSGKEWGCYDRLATMADRDAGGDQYGEYCMGTTLSSSAECQAPSGSSRSCIVTDQLLAVADKAEQFRYFEEFEGCAAGSAAESATNHGPMNQPNSVEGCAEICDGIDGCILFEMSECYQATSGCADSSECITWRGDNAGSLVAVTQDQCRDNGGTVTRAGGNGPKLSHRVYRQRADSLGGNEMLRLLHMSYNGGSHMCAIEGGECACHGMIVFAHTGYAVDQSIGDSKYAAIPSDSLSTGIMCTRHTFGVEGMVKSWTKYERHIREMDNYGEGLGFGCYCIHASGLGSSPPAAPIVNGGSPVSPIVNASQNQTNGMIH